MSVLNSPADWLVGGGEMGERIRARDWSDTPLGPLAQWPHSLRVAIGMMMPSRAQICLFWGPEFVVLYNDAYRPVFGGKHPSALGLPGREAWSEIWEHQLGPLLQGVVDTGEAFWASDLLFCLQRHGYLEETYFDISYDPVREESGRVAGAYCIVTETTGRVIGERRLRTLSTLGQVALQSRTVPDVLERSAQALGERPEEVAFALIYEWDAEKRAPRLGARVNVEADSPLASAPWPLDESLPAEGIAVDARDLRLSNLPGGIWPEPCSRVVVLPIRSSSLPDAFLVVGTSPRRALDSGYRDFLRLAASGIGSALASAKALEVERRRVDALAELDRAKTLFFSNISHEFRTPLTLLLGPLKDELIGDRLDPVVRKNLDVAYRNGLRLHRLVNTLLDFSRLEAGRLRASFRPTDLAAFTRELASNFESACARAGLRFDVACDALPEPGFVDPDMWEKVVLNLVSNAFKFTLEGAIAVSLRAEAGHAVLRVSDTGVGIAAESMPHLFQRFHRIEGVAARTHEGSGIGLAMVYELVRMHGGEIRAESAPGKGTTFEVRVPLGSAHLPAEQVLQEGSPEVASAQAPMFVQEALSWLRTVQGPHEAGARLDRGRERILVAEDNADMREYIERLLGEHWEVVAVPDGEAAMMQLLTGRFDMLLTDVMMPRMDGFGLLRAVRSDEALRDLPVVMLSARAGEEAKIEGREAGADDYLVKPFSARELVSQVRAHLALAKARRATARERELLLASERTARMDAQRQWDDLVRLFEQAPNPMVILRGREYSIQLANPAACRVWGRTAQQVLGKPLFEALPEAKGQGLEELLQQVMDTGEPLGGQVAVGLNRGGGEIETVHFDFVYSPLRAASGRVEGIAVTAFDVTEQVRAREELAASS
jgi:PAS domain S-box-containing protein